MLGTMNNPGTQLMTISDMSTVQAVLMVDETDTPNIAVGQKAMLTLDSYPGRKFDGVVTEVGHSPIQRDDTELQGLISTTEAINFKVKVKICRPAAEHPAGLLGHRRHHHRHEIERSDDPARGGRDPRLPQGRQGRFGSGQDRRGRLHRGRRQGCVLLPIKTGLTGELDIEVENGLKDGESVISGPFKTLRTIKEGDRVRAMSEDKKKAMESGAAGIVPSAMDIRELFATSLRSLGGHKLRSGLTLLGVIIGVMTVVAVVSVISGLNEFVATNLINLNPDVLVFTKFGILRSRSEFLMANRRKPLTMVERRLVGGQLPVVRRGGGSGGPDRSRQGGAAQARGRRGHGLHRQRRRHAQPRPRDRPLLQPDRRGARRRGRGHRRRHQGRDLPRRRSHRPHAVRSRLSDARDRRAEASREDDGPVTRQGALRPHHVPDEGVELRPGACDPGAPCRGHGGARHAWKTRSGPSSARRARPASRPTTRSASSARARCRPSGSSISQEPTSPRSSSRACRSSWAPS